MGAGFCPRKFTNIYACAAFFVNLGSARACFGITARRWHAHHFRQMLVIGARLKFKHAAQPHLNRGDTVNGAFQDIVKHHVPPEPQRPVSFFRKATYVGTFFEIIGRNP